MDPTNYVLVYRLGNIIYLVPTCIRLITSWTAEHLGALRLIMPSLIGALRILVRLTKN